MLDACLDLLLGSGCTVCGRPGRLLCAGCAAGLPTGAAVRRPTPCPPGLAVPVSAGEYDGALKALVNAHKERAQLSLARPLGALLAQAVHELLDQGPEPAAGIPCVLVPVPSRGRVVRERGHDPMLRVTRYAAGRLRRTGHPVWVVGVLRSLGVVRDQAGLGAEQRAANLAGSMAASAARAEQVRLRWPAARIVVTDDVLTTGSTAREAQRAVEDAGLSVSGIATVAATRRRACPMGHSGDSPASLPFSHGDD